MPNLIDEVRKSCEVKALERVAAGIAALGQGPVPGAATPAPAASIVTSVNQPAPQAAQP